MSATIPTTVSSLTVSKPSAMMQTSKTDLSPFTASEENHQFTTSFSIRAILSSPSTSQAEASFLSNPFSRHLLFAEDAGQVEYSPFPQHHCCQHGACAVGWQDLDKKDAGKKEKDEPNKRSRTIFTPVQLEQLESTFSKQQYVAGEERRRLAASLKLTETHVKVWFQNRRIRFRKQAQRQDETA